jgi:tetratricopeptide (TPR) repeat protein
MVLEESYDLAGALTETGEAVRLAPGSAVAHLNRGRVLFDLGRSAEAKPELETARRISPNLPESYYFLALIEKQAGRYKPAIAILQTVVKLQPRNATAWYLLGQSLEHEQQLQSAITAWKQTLAIEPSHSQALWSLARAVKPGDPDEAARLLAHFNEIQKERRTVDQAGTLGNDALAAGAAHDWPEAIRQFLQAIEVCGDCAIKGDLHKKLGLIDCQMGDIDNGEKELRLAQALKPGDPDIERVLGQIAAARTKRVPSRARRGSQVKASQVIEQRAPQTLAPLICVSWRGCRRFFAAFSQMVSSGAKDQPLRPLPPGVKAPAVDFRDMPTD